MIYKWHTELLITNKKNKNEIFNLPEKEHIIGTVSIKLTNNNIGTKIGHTDFHSRNEIVYINKVLNSMVDLSKT